MCLRLVQTSRSRMSATTWWFGECNGHDVTLKDANAMDLGASTVSGALHVTTGGPMTDSGTLTVMGATTINALVRPSPSRRLAMIPGRGDVTAGQTSLNDVGALEAELTTGVTTLTAGGDLTVSGSLRSNDHHNRDRKDELWGDDSGWGTCRDVGGAVTRSRCPDCFGRTTINAVDQTVTLDTTANDFTAR